MKKFWIITNGPQIISIMTGEFTSDQIPSGYQIETELDQSVILNEYGFYNNELVHVGVRPSPMHKLDSETPQWVVDDAQVAMYKNSLKQRVNNKREELLRSPVLFYNNYYDADERAITNLHLWKDQILPEGFVWMDAANEPHIINSEFIDNLLYAIAVRGTHLYNVSWDKKSEVDSLEYDGLMSYDIDAGW